MAPINFINYQNTMRRVMCGYIYTLKIEMQIKDNTWNCIILTVAKKNDYEI